MLLHFSVFFLCPHALISYSSDIVHFMLFALFDKLVIVNLCLVPEKPAFLVTNDRAAVKLSFVYIVKESQHIGALIWAECAA